MTRIKLIVTGDLAKLALGSSLQRILDQSGKPLQLLRPLKTDEVTTHPLPDPAQSSLVPTPMLRLANALIVETVVARPAPDLVMGIGDLELANEHQPQVVTAWLRRAIEAKLGEKYPNQSDVTRVREALRHRCSFHLLVPLVESYFFADPRALQRAGVPSSFQVPEFGGDVEQFESTDPDFLSLAAVRNEEKQRQGHNWWREERHPKRYLEFLVDRAGGLYEETTAGRKALEELEWPAAAISPSAAKYARSLFEDLSELLEIPNPLGSGSTEVCTYPARTSRPEDRVLRNI